MIRRRERHMFPGNNTSKGFYSYYRFILPQREANHIFCLKGGPGVGKSTFMRKIACRLQDAGLDAEYLHCSSDPDSLDGVLFPEIAVALIDGTSPHVIDPVHPGVVDEIVNLGEYWNLDGIKQKKTEILKINAEVGKTFQSAYRYLAAARCIFDNILEMLTASADPSGPWMEADAVIKREFAGISVGGKAGRVKKQFASAITPSGIVHFIDTLTDESYKVTCIENRWGAGVSDLLKKIAEEASARGLDVELFYCPMDPDSRIEHIILPGLKLAFLSQNQYYRFETGAAGSLDMTRYLDQGRLKQNKEALLFSEKTFRMLLDETILTLQNAKRMHDEMEQYYIPHMNFKKEDEKLEEIVRRILQYNKKQ